MKKMISLALAAMMLLTLVACGGNSDNSSAKGGFEAESATALMETVWNSYAEDEKFAVVGGDYDNFVDNAPGKFAHDNAEYMDGMLAIPADATAMVDDAASMMHMMNANTFTCGAYHLTDANAVDAFAQTMRDTIMNNQWMCGFPDKLIIAKVGASNVVVMFGACSEYGDAVTPVITGLQEAYGESVSVLFDEFIAVG